MQVLGLHALFFLSFSLLCNETGAYGEYVVKIVHTMALMCLYCNRNSNLASLRVLLFL